MRHGADPRGALTGQFNVEPLTGGGSWMGPISTPRLGARTSFRNCPLGRRIRRVRSPWAGRRARAGFGKSAEIDGRRLRFIGLYDHGRRYRHGPRARAVAVPTKTVRTEGRPTLAARRRRLRQAGATEATYELVDEPREGEAPGEERDRQQIGCDGREQR